MFESLYAKNKIFRDNMALFSRVRLEDVFTHLFRNDAKGKHIMANLTDDETRLETDLTAQTELITQVSATLTANANTIASLQAEVATLQAQGVDTTRLEADLTTLEGNNTALTAALPAAPAPASSGTTAGSGTTAAA